MIRRLWYLTKLSAVMIAAAMACGLSFEQAVAATQKALIKGGYLPQGFYDDA